MLWCMYSWPTRIWAENKSLHSRSLLLTAPKLVTYEELRYVMVCECFVLLLLVPRLEYNTK